MINLVLNDLGLSLKNRTGVLMIWNLWRTPVIEIATDWIRYEVKGVAFSVATLIVERSQGLDPWIDRSKGLLHLVTRSQNPWTVGVRAVEMEGVGKSLRPPSPMTRGRERVIDGRKEYSSRRRGGVIDRRRSNFLGRHV